MVLHFLPVIALVLYLLALFFLGKGESAISRSISPSSFFLSVGILCHFLSLFSIYSLRPINFLATSTSVAALILALIHAIYVETRLPGFKKASLLSILVLYLGSSVLLHVSTPQLREAKSIYLLWSHVAVTLFGILCFLAAGILSLGHLYESRALKAGSNREGRLAEVLGKLPPLRELSRLSLAAVKAGLSLSVIGLYLGALYTESTGAELKLNELKLILPSLLVIFYAGVLFSRKRMTELVFTKLAAAGIVLAITSLIVAAVR